MHRHPGSPGARDRLTAAREFAFSFFFMCVCVCVGGGGSVKNGELPPYKTFVFHSYLPTIGES